MTQAALTVPVCAYPPCPSCMGLTWERHECPGKGGNRAAPAATPAIEQDAVRVDVPHCERRLGLATLACTVDSIEGRPVHVHFPPDWRQTLERLCYPSESWVEGYLEGLARIAYVRRGR